MIKRYLIFIAILVIVFFYYEHRLNEAKANEDILMELYQSKNNSGYITLLKEGPPSSHWHKRWKNLVR
ncbi:hypothetical protein AB9M62_40525 [Bacillales bacterium AN1005]